MSLIMLKSIITKDNVIVTVKVMVNTKVKVMVNVNAKVKVRGRTNSSIFLNIGDRLDPQVF